LAIAVGRAWQSNREAATNSIEITENSHADSDSVPDLTRGTDEDGFLLVPYAPPLAAGEFLRVVRTELRPIALARMGIDVDFHLDEIAADIVLGEDGFPRAVRLLEERQF
jgi:hypothetical protein